MYKKSSKVRPRLRGLYKLKRLETGFSMLEAVVVVGVLLALAVGGFLSYGPIVANAKTAAAKSHASQVYTAVMVALSDGDPSTNPTDIVDDFNSSDSEYRAELSAPADPAAAAMTTAAYTPTADSDFCLTVTHKTRPSIFAQMGNCPAPPSTSPTVEPTTEPTTSPTVQPTVEATPTPTPTPTPVDTTVNYGPRDNEITNPSAETTLTGWDNPGNRATLTRSSEQAYSGTNSAKVVSNVTMGTDQIGTGTGAKPLPASTTYTYTKWVYVPTGSPAVRLQVQIPFNTLATGASSTLKDQWQQISVTFTTTTAQNYYLYALNAETTTAGNYFYADAGMLEKTNQVRPYFDGSTPENSVYIYSWVAAAHESASKATLK